MAKNDSFFNEIYGTYFNVVSSILRQAQEKQLTKDSLEFMPAIADKHNPNTIT